MAWTDPATDKQISALYWMLSNRISLIESQKRCQWLKQHRPTRKDMSDENSRVINLCNKHRPFHTGAWPDHLVKELLDSKIWEGYCESE